MKPHLSIRASGTAYSVRIGAGALAALREVVDAECRGGTRFVVIARRVRDAHRERIEQATEGWERIVVDDGEEAKSLDTVATILDRLLEGGARRDSVVIAVGGGMLGDTAGFAASILLRGVDLVQVPTTLLAQVDSSIGGKLGVNHRLGKNLIGSFHPPRAVVADLDLLATLPEREFLSGVFEAMKGGVIGDPRLFDLALRDLRAEPSALEQLVRRAVALKAAIVEADEREGGARRLLNYGHTIGHGIEAALGYRGLTHGEAVAWGMIGANAVAAGRGVLPPEEQSRIDDAIRSLTPRPPAGIDGARVLGAMELDKKFTSGSRVMVLPSRVGECLVVDDVTEAELAAGVDAALAG
ncbi:MAG TPA: 3-dehydroquinate synthase [Thermoanaerobaculia bacterium]|nr:3-dehydroquinate synthase [Thermoanaerobaculia bacterium]